MSEQQQVKFEGVEMTIGGRAWVIPALSLRQIKQLMPLIQQIDTGGDQLRPEGMEAATKVVHAALSRNYPDITAAEVDEMLDMRNIQSVIEAVMGTAGLERKGEG